MNLPRYDLKAEKSLMVFEFVSDGPKGTISKIIKFDETALKNFYNLAFGDKNPETGFVDDEVVSNNGDREKILATIVRSVILFSEKEKDAWIYAIGSNESRTRLYQMSISKYLDEVELNFHIFGLQNGEWVKFEKGVNYSAFLVKRK